MAERPKDRIEGGRRGLGGGKKASKLDRRESGGTIKLR